MKSLQRGNPPRFPAGAVVALTFLLIGAGTGAAAEKSGATYERDVKPIIAQRCLACHGSDSPSLADYEKNKEAYKKKMKGPRMDTYETLMIFVSGEDAGALMRRLDDGKNTKDRKPGNMFATLGGTDPERAQNLEVIKKWVGTWTLKRKKEMTPGDLAGIRALEK